MVVSRTFDLLERYQQLYPLKEDVLCGKTDGEWVKIGLQEYIQNVDRVSIGLMSMGFRQGDKIASISNNRPEWNYLDMGMAQIGVVHVPIYPTLSREDLSFILEHSEPKFLIVSDKLLYDKLKPVILGVKSIERFLTFNSIESADHWSIILKEGERQFSLLHSALDTIKDNISPDDLATIIYTSGTTGSSKGVMLSHRNLVSNFVATANLYHLGSQHRALSFLPLCHIFERTLNYNYQYKGIGIYYAENMGTILENMKEVKPHIFITVPRLLERIYQGITGRARDLSYIKRAIFFWAIRLSSHFERHKKQSWFFNRQRKIADWLIFSKWREALGGEICYIVSGSATLQSKIARVFGMAGLEILEGYGLTETSPVISVTNPITNEIRYGTVGPVLEGVQVKLAPDGEILCKGPGVMMGYYKDLCMTQEVIDNEGWFHTGDIGVFLEGKYLKITDRKKEIFKLSNGKYISPQVIENRFRQSEYIDQIMVVGENEKFASALIVPSYTTLRNWCQHHDLPLNDMAEMILHPKVCERFRHEVASVNRHMGQAEHIKKYRLISQEWTMQSGELSPTLKLKRKFIMEKYSALVNDLYLRTDEDLLN